MRAGRLLGRAAVPALLWVALNGGDLASWAVGVPAIAAAAWLGEALAPPRRVRWRWSYVPAFFAWFVRQSLAGGVDVARLAWRRPGRLDPATFAYDTRLPAGAPRLLFCAVVSLLPGTLVYALEGDRVHLHVLSPTQDVAGDLRALEERIARLAGVASDASGRGGA